MFHGVLRSCKLWCWVINCTVVVFCCVFSYLPIHTFSSFLFRALSSCWLMTGRSPCWFVQAATALTVTVFFSTSLGDGTLCQHPALNQAGKWSLTQYHSFWLLPLVSFNLMATCCHLGWVFKSGGEIMGSPPMAGLLPTSGGVRPPFPPYCPLDVSLVWRGHLDECSTVAKAGCEGLGELSLGMFSSQGIAFKAAESFVLEMNWSKLHQEGGSLCLWPGPCEQPSFLPGC